MLEVHTSRLGRDLEKKTYDINLTLSMSAKAPVRDITNFLPLMFLNGVTILAFSGLVLAFWLVK